MGFSRLSCIGQSANLIVAAGDTWRRAGASGADVLDFGVSYSLTRPEFADPPRLFGGPPEQRGRAVGDRVATTTIGTGSS